jgi:NAD(P)-dependent dehydrogenase (short-subunit alcohol dehydrogenase family)
MTSSSNQRGEVRGLAGKVAVMAGGAGGIGSASSIRLAEEGAAVVVGDLDSTAAKAVAAEIMRRGGNASAVTVDISAEESVQALINSAVELQSWSTHPSSDWRARMACVEVDCRLSFGGEAEQCRLRSRTP